MKGVFINIFAHKTKSKQTVSDGTISSASSSTTFKSEQPAEESQFNNLTIAISLCKEARTLEQKIHNLSDASPREDQLTQQRDDILQRALNIFLNCKQDSFETIIATAFLYYRLGQFNDFVSHIANHPTKRPTSFSKWFIPERLALQEKILQDIQRLYESSCNLQDLVNNTNIFNLIYPQDPRPYEYLAAIYFNQQKNIENAISLMNIAIKIAPQNPDYHRILADIYTANEDYDKALVQTDIALAQKPESTILRYEHSLIAFKLYQATDSSTFLDISFNHAVIAHAYDSEHQDIQSHLQKVSSLKHNSEHKRLMLLPNNNKQTKANSCSIAKSLAKQGFYQDAISIAERIIRENETYVDSYNILGYCYFKMQQFDKALDYYQKILQLNPNDNNCKSNIQLFLTTAGFEHRANAILEQYKETHQMIL